MRDAILKDLRYACRGIARNPAFVAVAVLSLGLGVGVNTAMFSLVDSLLFRPLPVTSPATLVDVFTSADDTYATTSFADYEDLRAQNTVFTEMTGYSPMLAPLSLGDRSRIVLGQIVTANHFAFFGVPPLLGRTLQPADDAPGAERVVVIAHRMWQRELGGDPAVIGRTLTMRGLPYTIVGVMPPAFTGVVALLTPELWMPIVHSEDVEPVGISDSVPSPTGRTRLERRGTRWMFVKGRLKPGVSAAQASANVALLGRQLADAYPATNKDRRMSAVPTAEVRLLVPQAGGVLSLGAAGVMSVVGLVLLIACANLAGMLLARASTRGKEISVRLAVGASRGRLIQQLVMEGLVLGALGAVVALGCAWIVLALLTTVQFPLPFDVALDLRLDLRVTAFAALAAALAGLAASLVPALKASRPDLVSDLRGETPAARVGPRRWSLRDALVVAQVALTAVLLVVAGLLLRSLRASQSADVGFETRGLAAIAFDTDMMRYEPERGLQFWREALAHAQAMPGVASAALVSPTLPFTFNFNQQEVRADSRSYPEGQRGETIENVAISPGYLDTLGVRLLEGRDIAAADAKGAPEVVVINATMARTYWPGQSAVGHTIQTPNTGRVYRVVGVAADHKRHGVLERPSPYFYVAAAQQPSRYNFLLARTNGDAAALVAALRRDLLAMEPGIVFMDATTMEQHLVATLMPARVGAMLATAFGGLGTLLAAIGLYGVLAFSVARRTREIGIRMAIGADPGGILRMVMRQGYTLVAAGLLTGGLLAAGAAYALRDLLYATSPVDPVAWSAASAALLASAALANAIPARRAMRVEPLTALRTD